MIWENICHNKKYPNASERAQRLQAWVKLFFSKAYSGNCQSRQTLQLIWKESLVSSAQNISLWTHRTVKKHFFKSWKHLYTVQDGSTQITKSKHREHNRWGWRSYSSFSYQIKDMLGTNHKMHFRTTVNSRSKAPGKLFKNVWQLKWVKHAKNKKNPVIAEDTSCLERTTTMEGKWQAKWVWGIKQLAKWEGNRTANPKTAKNLKKQQDLKWERFMPKVMLLKDTREDDLLPSLWCSSTSSRKEQRKCPMDESSARHQSKDRSGYV